MTDRYAGIVDELHTRVESLRADLRLTRIDLREQMEQARRTGIETRAELDGLRFTLAFAKATCEANGGTLDITFFDGLEV